MHPISLYIHIPFCQKKCQYCNFYSEEDKIDLQDKYFSALIEEFTQSTKKYKIDKLNTVFFGGGTPSLISLENYQTFFNVIINFIDENTEITLEANPGTITPDQLHAFRKLGFNRISLGVQSFNDKQLEALGRIHNSQTALDIIHNAYKSGFKNINIDLMYALPNQTLEEFKNDIHTALEQNIKHISLYNLQVEEGTPFAKKDLKLPSNELETTMYLYAIKTFKEHGFHHYEISNFAQPGYECQHNLTYWKCTDYLGIGAGAHSLMKNKRFYHENNIEIYISHPIQTVEEEVNLPIERIFMGLRQLVGIDENLFLDKESELKLAIEDGLLQKQNNKIKLTSQGLLLANNVFELFI